MTNKYGATCVCGSRVKPGQGTLLRSDRGGWYVRCTQCSPASLAPRFSVTDPVNLDRDYEDRRYAKRNSSPVVLNYAEICGR